MSSPQDLITQVHNSEEDTETKASPPPQRSCFWRYFCCCCTCCGPKPEQSGTPMKPTSTGGGAGSQSAGTASVSTGGGSSGQSSQSAGGAGAGTVAGLGGGAGGTGAGTGSGGGSGGSGGGAGGGETKRAAYAGVPETPPHPLTKYLLPPLPADQRHKKCLVLDLDETLVHSSFKPIPNPDFIISIELDNVIHKVYVRKRPGVDNFMKVVGEKFEVVVFTASLAKYADPLLDILDRGKVIRTRLFREACVQHYGNYVKDLTHLGRSLDSSVIIDNSPFSYMFQPENAIPISSWFNDKNDRALYDLLPFLDTLSNCDDVVQVLQRHKLTFNSGT